MNGINSTLIKTQDSLITLLRVEDGFINDKGETYDREGTFIDFPRELSSKQRRPRDPAAVEKRLNHKRVACLVHERRNYSYYHWTYETLPKLIYLSNHRKELKIDKLYFHFGRLGHPYQRQALRSLGFQYWKIIDAKRIKSLKASEIVVIKLNETRLEPSVDLCKLIKSTFIKNPTANPTRRIYLTRDHVKTGRKIINENELRFLLDSYGFEIIVADNLSVAAQAKLFNQSNYIVSPHGAALANIAFCEPGAKILELFNQTDQTTWSQIYSTIAQACGFELIPIAPQQTTEIGETDHRSDFYADLKAITAVMAAWSA
ncbi:MAG: glycosyltransferase family 61 protein [Cyanobacteria bacterium P01_C01_bin.118]